MKLAAWQYPILVAVVIAGVITESVGLVWLAFISHIIVLVVATIQELNTNEENSVATAIGNGIRSLILSVVLLVAILVIFF